ncbi:MAG: hypothetical protein IRY87_18515 [Acetobacteraceae bacterium]|uniref:hypothetical protein n=1 Tax=Siccirubricoccus phaeus TaxID=2595053 RepID=UPI00165AD6F0|nr:hypothetical protein [Siccirubricoccus phaeus]MBX6744034.1 hypothetical protein [Acetobacteraceae bacterium]
MTALFQHYLPPAPAMLPYVSGRFYASAHARAVGGAVAMAANRLYCVPYVLARSGLFSAMAVSVTTGAAGVLRMALAADDGTGHPGRLIDEPLADADTTAAGSAICPFAQPRWIPAGIWWLLLCFSGTPSVRGTSTQAFSGGNTLLLGSAAADGGAGGGAAGSENGFFAPLTHQAGAPIMPSPPSGLAYLVNAAAPLPTLQAA